MIKITDNLSWDVITIGMYKDILKVKNNDPLELIKIIYEIENPRDMPLSDFNTCVTNISALLDSKPATNKFIKDEYHFEGRTYKMILNGNDMTAGQFMDYSHYVSNNEVIECLYVLLNVSKKADKDIIDRNMYVSDLSSVAFFFEGILKRLLRRIQSSTQVELVQNPE